MAMRLRVVDNLLVALCAARSVEKEGDIYLDDGWHYALAQDFDRRHPEYFGDDPSHDVEAVAWLARQTPLSTEIANAIDIKLTIDRNEVWGFQHFVNPHTLSLIEREENNNENRTQWNKTYA